MVKEKTFEEWGLGKAPLNSRLPSAPIPGHLAQVIADYADDEERVIVRSYPWPLRPVIRWLRRATRQ